jgi:hypothetical protein
MNRAAVWSDVCVPLVPGAAANGDNMTIFARKVRLFADFTGVHISPRISLWILAAAVLAALAVPAADARAVRRTGTGGYDGVWNVLIITQRGHCDPAYSYPFYVAGGRISSAGAATVSGTVGRGGGVMVRISAGGSVASGSGRLARSSGAGRWSARLSGGDCSGRWEARRG